MIYTIGYGNRNIDDFMQLLQKYQIRYLVDVRSKPYSRVNPDFSRIPLQNHLSDRKIAYLFLGHQLGGRPDDPDCYTPAGKVDYLACEEKNFYQTGVARLEKASLDGYTAAIMCSELKPHECHRSKLIGRTLTHKGIPVKHIDEEGQLKSQTEVIDILREQLGLNKPRQRSLFMDDELRSSQDETPLLTSRGAYRSKPETDPMS